jgi:hypothetical protein
MYECYECEIVVNVDHVFICNPYLLHNYCFFKICIFDGGPGVTESPSWVDTYLFLMSILWGRFFIIMTYIALVSHTKPLLLQTSPSGIVVYSYFTPVYTSTVTFVTPITIIFSIAMSL